MFDSKLISLTELIRLAEDGSRFIIVIVDLPSERNHYWNTIGQNKKAKQISTLEKCEYSICFLYICVHDSPCVYVLVF